MARRRRRQKDSAGLVIIVAIFVGLGIVINAVQALYADLTSGVFGRAIYAPAMLAILGAVITGAYLLHRVKQRRQQWRANSFSELLSLTPTQFEYATQDLLSQIGYRDMRRVGGAGDLAADLTGITPNGEKVIVQCKHYMPGNRVGSREIQLFIGMTYVHHRATRGIFVTTSSFTRPAAELARQHQIQLIDADGLCSMLEEVHRRDAQHISRPSL